MTSHHPPPGRPAELAAIAADLRERFPSLVVLADDASRFAGMLTPAEDRLWSETILASLVDWRAVAARPGRGQQVTT
ncbi:MAG TPA: hypothetical protein VLJ59_21460 [Mycobacteriales bacterium]|nr:hypothetical protein [Mycobacteriales bacterium]